VVREQAQVAEELGFSAQQIANWNVYSLACPTNSLIRWMVLIVLRKKAKS